MSCSECAPYGLQSCPMCEANTTDCPDCKGFGYTNFLAWDIRKSESVEVSPETFICLPKTEEDANRKNENYYQFVRERCKRCGGTGYL